MQKIQDSIFQIRDSSKVEKVKYSTGEAVIKLKSS